MKSDQEKWNAKYQQAKDKPQICAAVERFWPLASPKGRALDLAAGLGVNSIFLAEQGFAVDAVDISNVALDRLTGRHPQLTPICADLDHYTITPKTYDLILNIHFLNRRLFPLIMEGLKPGGLLIVETFLEGDPQGADEPACRDYLLRPNELLHAFIKLHVLFYEEKKNVPPIRASHLATLVARR
jgi:SAM-dependent methyltransferase